MPILRTEPQKRTDAEQARLKNGLRGHFEQKVWPGIAAKDAALKRADELKKQIAQYKNEHIPRVMVMSDAQPRQTFVLERGNYEKPLEKVAFATPAFLPPMPADAPRNRLGLARWLFAPDHPLTARVQVNRYWQLFFGTGLVKTSEDFGVQSEAPAYPELLDWLAVEFREPTRPAPRQYASAADVNPLENVEDGSAAAGPRPWGVKHVHRLIVTSATYRQSSKITPELLARDPENRLLARGGRFRMAAMTLRDVALAASGLLDRRVGGNRFTRTSRTGSGTAWPSPRSATSPTRGATAPTCTAAASTRSGGGRWVRPTCSMGPTAKPAECGWLSPAHRSTP